MKVYRHYKNKLYKWLAEVRHSETEEAMVLYKALSSNSLWVRPKSMFFESLPTGAARFSPVELQIKREAIDTDERLQLVSSLAREIFVDFEPSSLRQTFAQVPLTVWWLYIDGEVAGFKLGFPQSDAWFYSWLGGIRAPWRQLGGARMLMDAMLLDLASERYPGVRTKTLATNLAMLSLNLRSKFIITGTESSPRGLKVLLSRPFN